MAEPETAEERLTRLDNEEAAAQRAEAERRGDEELARLFNIPVDPQPVQAVDPRKRQPRKESALQEFIRKDAARKAAAAADEVQTQDTITLDERASDKGFLRDAIAPGTSALSNRDAQIAAQEAEIEGGSDELQRLKQAQSTDLQN